MKVIVSIVVMIVSLLSACGSSEPKADAAPASSSTEPARGKDRSGRMSESNGEKKQQPDSFRIVVKKSERKLYLYEINDGREKLRQAYSIALGNKPVGHKKRQGDGATPEGDYYLTHRNPKSSFYLSLGVSYPNINDAAAGLQSGLITKPQHDAIVLAIKNREKPLQNTRLGGDIFIHGGGASRALGLVNDWTLGCVALENEDIKELFDLLPVKTPVRIEP